MINSLLDEIEQQILLPANQANIEEIEMIDYVLNKLAEVTKAFSLVRMSLPQIQINQANNYENAMVLLW